ncbi:MAG: cation:proton antiporter [Deltaproteobacteria bacterium]|nr:cation:proton antiporter [Deltaproteobacteria bacterium]
MDPHTFLRALVVVLGTAGVTAIVFQRLRLPVVLGYMLAGLLVGPHVPFPLIADAAVVETLAETGVVLLMFVLGLEFRIGKLLRVGPTAGVTAILQSSLMLWGGYALGQAFGWTVLESLFAGAIVAISSTTIIAKAFDEQGVRGSLRELVVGILIVEDLIAILLMALLTTVASGEGLSPGVILASGGRLLGALVVLVVLGVAIVPRAARAIHALGRPEVTVVSAVGFCFGVAFLAMQMGYSVALGAFIAGSLVAESGVEKEVERLILPVRDVFAAIFFVSVGMMIDPSILKDHAGAVVALTLVVVIGKIVTVAFGALLTGHSARTSVQAGMSLAQIGEFSFIIAGLGLTLGATRPFLYPVAIAVSVLTTFTTPWLIRVSAPVAEVIERHLPQRVQTFVALYADWLGRARAARGQPSGSRKLRLFKRYLLDAAMLAGVGVAVAVVGPAARAFVGAQLDLDARAATALVLGVALLVAVPFVLGLIRVSRALGLVISEAAMPRDGSGLDLNAAPRRALVVTHQIALLLVIALPVLALTRPLVPVVDATAVLLLLLLVVGVVFWRRAGDLAGHVRAGTEVLVAALAEQTASGSRSADTSAVVRRVLPGLGAPATVELVPRSLAVGRNIDDSEARRLGAVVLAIVREGVALMAPADNEVLRAGDIVVLAGSSEAVDAARHALEGQREN